ncbi:MAG TPA: enoyl-CoA hydratase-related protein [Polyangiaceae bacterium]|nr:enoyl-CoA hydratase-related protein [Polyangiaceae bacterium]
MSDVSAERRDGIALVHLDRPDRMNALSRNLLLELEALGAELENDTALRAVVITGRGERAFSAGADLKERVGLNEADVLELLHLFRRAFAWLDRLPVPSVAAINGVALGGGLELALACDLRVAHESALLGLPETSLAIIPGAGGTQRLPRIVGRAKATELILLGRRLNAAEALEIGLVHRVVPANADFIAATLEYVEPIVSGAPIAQRAAIQALRASELPLSEGLAAELDAYESCLYSEDRREALRAFQEKRKPRFQGR